MSGGEPSCSNEFVKRRRAGFVTQGDHHCVDNVVIEVLYLGRGPSLRAINAGNGMKVSNPYGYAIV